MARASHRFCNPTNILQLILLFNQIKAIIFLYAIYCISKPASNGLLLLFKRHPHSRSGNNSMCRHIARIVIPGNAIPDKQADTGFLKLGIGIQTPDSISSYFSTNTARA